MLLASASTLPSLAATIVDAPILRTRGEGGANFATLQRFNELQMIRDEISVAGFALVPSLVDSAELVRLVAAAEQAVRHPLVRARRGSAFGLRNLFETMPAARDLAGSAKLLDLVKSILGPGARPVKGILFDKTEHANWAVPWHQDVTIAVREHCLVPGYESWSEKDGIPHVQPPVEVLEQILAVRIHLDDCPPENGALKIIPESHAHGRLTDTEVEHWKSTVTPVTCAAHAGDALFLRPLLLHSSGTALTPGHRRVLHFEYAAVDLPGGLEWAV